MPLVLAVDQSTSATKTLLFDENGRSLDRQSCEHKQIYPQPGWAEHDAEEIWQNTLATLRAVVNRQRARLQDILCLSITNQRETIVVFERGSGKPLHNALVWQDRRGDPLCDEQSKCGREPTLHARTGLKLDGYFSGSKLQWLVRNNLALARKLASGEALIGTIDTYLIYRLTNGSVFATDSTNASRTLLFDIEKLRWDDELCRWWQVPLAALPEVRDSSAHFGETTLDGTLEKPLPICGVMGDSQASLFAQRCYQPGSAKVTFGTGSSVLLNIGPKMKLSQKGVVTALAWVLNGVPTYAFEGIIISSAATLSWLREQLGLFANVAELDRLALEVESNEGVYLVPAFSGLGLPHWQPAARAAIVGLSNQSNRRHIARAGIESIAYQICDALNAMKAEAGVQLKALHGDGGTTANKFLMQFTADLTGVDLRISGMADCSPLGAALAGLLGMGVFRSLDEISGTKTEETVYQPSAQSADARNLYSGWQKAVRQVLPQS
ncbi:MAG: glycerol kinase GlpK [Nibricoccus sp.]